MTVKAYSRSDVVDTARLWIGTPYRAQHSVRGAGCDCLGLVRGVYRNLHGDEPETPPPYSPAWGEVGDHSPLVEAAQRHLHAVALRPHLPAGTVVIFRMKRGAVAKHCGIITGEGRFIHAYQGQDVVVEAPLVHYWSSRIVAAFDYPAVT